MRLLNAHQRFRPITLERPKALLPLANVPMIEYVLEFLASNGVEEVFVFCCAHAEQITSYLEQSAWSSTSGFVVHTIVSTNCISAGEALRLIDHRHVVRADFVLVHGDVVANMDLRRALKAHGDRRKKEKLAIMTMCFKPVTRQLREDRLGESNLVVVTDPAIDRVLHYEAHAAPSDFPFSPSAKAPAKPQLAPVALDASLFSDHANVRVRTDVLDCHVDICAPEVLYLFTDNFDYQNIRRDFVVGTLNERELGNNIYAHFLEQREYAVRVDSLRTYDAVSRDVVGRWAYPMTPDANALPRGERSTYAHAFANAYREKNVHVAASATVGPGTVLGEGCAIGERSSVEASTLGRGAVVGADCDVRGSYVQRNVTIHDGARVTSAFLCEDVVVPAGAVVGKGAVLSYGVVVGAGHVVADYARLSLATQPARDEDEYDSDEDGLEVGSLPGDGRRASLGGSAGGSGFGRGEAHAFGSDDDQGSETAATLEAGSAFLLTDRERAALQKARQGSPSVDDAGEPVWSAEAVGADGAGRLWHLHGSDQKNQWRFSVAPPDASRAAAAYAAEDAADSDDEASRRRGGGGGGSDDSGSEASDDEGGETVFRREVAETFLRCVKHGYAEANAVVELQGLKMAENRTFADIARYVLMTVLGLTLPAPKDVTKENLKLYPSAPPATAAELLKSAREKVARWAPLLARFLKSEDDQVEMLLTLEEYCSEDEVFRGMGGALLVPAFAKILHMLYDMDVLSEVSVLAWAREKEGAEEEDKKFLALAAPFVAWLKEADEESEDSDEASEDSDSDE